MNVVDSCGWLEYFVDGPQANFYAPYIEAPKTLIVPTICLTEVVKKILGAKCEDSALAAAATMQIATICDLTDDIAILAAHLGIKHKLPLADSIVLATAQNFKATLYTQDADFKGIEGVKMP